MSDISPEASFAEDIIKEQAVEATNQLVERYDKIVDTIMTGLAGGDMKRMEALGAVRKTLMESRDINIKNALELMTEGVVDFKNIEEKLKEILEAQLLTEAEEKDVDLAA